jgi:ABC-type Fe3+/spermidine/putrescine transport system ATPase subunit
VLLLHDGGIVCSGTPEQVWSDPGSVWAARFLDAGNVISGIVISNTEPLQVETSAGVFELKCGHNHLVGEKVNLLVRRQGVSQAAAGRISGVVADVVFRQDGFKVTLENGLNFYLSSVPQMGEMIYLTIPATGIKCLL